MVKWMGLLGGIDGWLDGWVVGCLDGYAWVVWLSGMMGWMVGSNSWVC